MDARNKLANLFVDHEVAVMTPGGDSWLTRDQRAMVVAALREYVSQPVSEATVPVLDAINEPCKGCGKRPIDFMVGESSDIGESLG